VLGGLNPVVNATVTLYAAGSSPSSPAQVLGTTTTGLTGGFSLSALQPSSPVFAYAIATGGDGGKGPNSRIALMATLGPVTSFPISPAATINELTTVASAYALSQFFNSPQDVRDSATPELSIAFQAIGNLVDASTGAAGPAISNSINTTTLMRFNTLGNAIAGCVEGASDAGSCSGLCEVTGLASSCDTLTAAETIARMPAAIDNSALFGLGKTGPYAPALAEQVAEWTLSLGFAATSAGTIAVTVDPNGNLWFVTSLVVGTVPTPSKIFELSPAGQLLAGPAQAGLMQAAAIAADQSGFLWVTDAGANTVLKINPSNLSSSAFATGTGPAGVAIDAANHVWVANFGADSLSEFDSSGTPVGSSPFSGGGLSGPAGVAIDDQGNVWIANRNGNSVSEFSSAGAAISPATGFIDRGLFDPLGAALAPNGDVWISNFGVPSQSPGTSMSRLVPAPPSPPSFSSVSGNGLIAPSGVAIDGSGNVWVADAGDGDITELLGPAGTSPGPGFAGFIGPGVSAPAGVAIDGAGNVWVANSLIGETGQPVTEFIGAATPVKPPLIEQPVKP